MAKRKTTVYLDDEVFRATKVLAARTGQREYDIVNDALRAFLGFSAIQDVWKRSSLSEEEASNLAYSELRTMRNDR